MSFEKNHSPKRTPNNTAESVSQNKWVQRIMTYTTMGAFAASGLSSCKDSSNDFQNSPQGEAIEDAPENRQISIPIRVDQLGNGNIRIFRSDTGEEISLTTSTLDITIPRSFIGSVSNFDREKEIKAEVTNIGRDFKSNGKGEEIWVTISFEDEHDDHVIKYSAKLSTDIYPKNTTGNANTIVHSYPSTLVGSDLKKEYQNTTSTPAIDPKPIHIDRQ